MRSLADSDSLRSVRTLLLGGSGLLSGATLDACLAAGHEVCVVSRGRRPLPAHPRLRTRSADRRDPAALALALAGERFDFTVDFLAFQRDDVERLLAVCDLELGRLVGISSGQVYLVTASPRPPFREADAEMPLMEEPSPGTRDHDEWAYGMGKRAVEAALRDARQQRGTRALALRLPVIQGERDGAGSRRLWAWLERMRDGGPVLLPEGGHQRVRFLDASDAARALVTLAALPSWPEEPALNLAQPDEPTLREFLERVATLAGVRPRFVPVPAQTLVTTGLADTCAPYWGRWCSRPDPSRAFEALALRTRTSEEYLPDVVRAHLERLPSRSHPGYARRAEELALAAQLP
jgi:nucleoside-diphosphate-sugar epimerase